MVPRVVGPEITVGILTGCENSRRDNSIFPAYTPLNSRFDVFRPARMVLLRLSSYWRMGPNHARNRRQRRRRGGGYREVDPETFALAGSADRNSVRRRRSWDKGLC